MMTTEKTVEGIEAGIKAGYRVLQKVLKELKANGAIAPATKINGSMEALVTIARGIIEALTPIAGTEKAVATNKEKFDAIVSTLPFGTIVNNCDFGDRTLSGDQCERAWLSRIGNGGITLQRLGDFYITYAGDAVRMAIALNTPFSIRKKVAITGVPAHAIARYTEELRVIGITSTLM